MDNKKIEDKILNPSFKHKSLDQILTESIEAEIQQNIGKKTQLDNSVQFIDDFLKLPDELVFDKNCVWSVYNRKNKTQSFINGIQAKALLGTNNIARNKITNKVCDSFFDDNYYVKFVHYSVL